ncbi:MAG: ornithine cyclodeaminase family protein [Chloroflexi bacterium]|nr:ornithine cyclodeaminase family protein [Chloroflexota bacterium]
MHLRVLSATDVRKALPMADAIEGMKAAYAQLSTREAIAPLRAHMEIPEHQATTLLMPAYLSENNELAVKIVSIFPENSKKNLPVIYATVLVMDGETGRPLAIMNGAAITAIRTGAGSGAATDLLARKDAEVVAILGSGVQARTQLEAVCTVRDIREVRVYSPTRENAVIFAREMKGSGPIPQLIRIMGNAETAVRDADIICAATSSSTPVLNYRWLSPGTHINGVGSYLPTMQEIDEETVKQAVVVIDSHEAALAEAGDLIMPLQNGTIQEGHIQAELGEIVAGTKPSRINSEQITFFKSVGVAVQDVVAARIALQNATAQQLGTVVNM